jgi:cell wall-associated NlpC family hydrolase
LRHVRLLSRVLVPAALAMAVLVGVAEPPSAAAATAPTAAARLIRAARAEIGHRYVYGSAGPRSFDCSGLVLYALRHSGNGRVVARGHRSAASIYRQFRLHHKASRTGGRPGDLVVWGGGKHIGIYLGHGKAISALTRRGVRIHSIRSLTSSFTAFLHTGLSTHR